MDQEVKRLTPNELNKGPYMTVKRSNFNVFLSMLLFFSKSNYMCKFLICHDMLRSECLLLLNINFVNSGKECKKAIIF